MIEKCDCAHPYQDKKYGKENRVHTVGTGQNPKIACTVCGKKK